MHRKIVVGWDGSEQGRDALALAGQLRAEGGVVIAACVYPDPGGMRARTNERPVIDSAAEVAAKARTDISEGWLSTCAAPGHSIPHGLHKLVEKEEADLVVVGSSHRGRLSQTLAGNVASRLLTGSPCAVAVAPKGFRAEAGSVRVIGVAYDGSAEAQSALQEAAALGTRWGAAIRLIGVVAPMPVWFGAGGYAPPPPSAELVREQTVSWQQDLEEAAQSLRGATAVDTELRHGSPGDELVEASGHGLDLMVTGSRAYGPLDRVMLGSTAGQLLRSAPCPVVVTPRGAS